MLNVSLKFILRQCRQSPDIHLRYKKSIVQHCSPLITYRHAVHGNNVWHSPPACGLYIIFIVVVRSSDQEYIRRYRCRPLCCSLKKLSERLRDRIPVAEFIVYLLYIDNRCREFICLMNKCRIGIRKRNKT